MACAPFDMPTREAAHLIEKPEAGLLGVMVIHSTALGAATRGWRAG